MTTIVRSGRSSTPAFAKPAWSDGLAPVTVQVDWDTGRHDITWRDGKLVLHHHRDQAAEAAFTALGGERCPCLDLLEAWPRWQRDPEVLVRWADPGMPAALATLGLPPGAPMPHTPGQVFALLRSRFRAVHAQLSGPFRGPQTVRRSGASRGRPASPHASPPAPSAQQRQQMLAQFEERHRELWAEALLWALPQPLYDRLALATVVGAGRRREQCVEWVRWRRPVEVATTARAVPALQEGIRFWRGRVEREHRRPTVEAWVTNPGEPVSLYGLVDRAGGWAAASLEASWLTDVWARGLAAVDGCFVLTVSGWEEYPARLSVLAARWERRLGDGSTPVLEPAVAIRSPGGWALRWV